MFGSIKTPEVKLKLRSAFQILFARRSLQPLWTSLFHLAALGMGFSSIDPRFNGEHKLLRDLTRRLSENRSVVLFDVGANEGDFSYDLACKFPHWKFHLFEPNLPTYRRLTERFSQVKNTKISNVGVSSSNKRVLLFDQQGRDGTGRATMLDNVFSDVYSQKSFYTEVDTVTLDGYVIENGIDHIDFLKIDVEGHEPEIIDGAADLILRKKIDFIQLEFNIHNAINGLTFYKLGHIFNESWIFRILPSELLLVKKPDHYMVKSHNEIFKYCNYLIVRDDSRLLDLLSIKDFDI